MPVTVSGSDILFDDGSVQTTAFYTPQVTGLPTFTNSTNNISLTGIGSLPNLEVGDVIQISGSASNNGEYTVEVITDANNVIVNQAHAGAASSKSLVDETSVSTVTIKLLVKWYLAPIGLGQGWANVLADRNVNQDYDNLTGRSIVVYARASADNGNIQIAINIDGAEAAQLSLPAIAGVTVRQGVSLISQRASTYRVVRTGGIDVWRELR